MCIYDLTGPCDQRCGHLPPATSTQPNPSDPQPAGPRSETRSLDQIFSLFRTLPEIPNITNRTGFEGVYGRLEQTLERQWQVLKDITEKIKSTNEIVGDLEREVTAMKRAFKTEEEQKAGPSARSLSEDEDVFTAKSLLATKYGEGKEFDYALKLFSDFKLPLFKGQEFSLVLRVTDKAGAVQRFDFPLFCSVRVYKASKPLEDITSESIMLEGTTGREFTGSSDIEFPNLQFNEITANIGQGWVFLYVSVDSMDSVRPLILENVRVKSRMPKET